MRPSKVMAKALRAAFQRMTHRARRARSGRGIGSPGAGSGRRCIGLDAHREFAQVAVRRGAGSPATPLKDWVTTRGRASTASMTASTNGTTPSSPAMTAGSPRQAPPRPGSPQAELAPLRARVAALESQNTLLATERDILRQAAKVFCRGDALVNRLQFVADPRYAFEVKRLGAPAPGGFDWSRAPGIGSGRRQASGFRRG